MNGLPENRIHHELIKLSDANHRFKIPFKPEYGEGIIVSFTFVKEGELYITQVPVELQLPNRQLTIKPITFRDRLLPGSKESWKFRITDADSTIVSAEVLTSMYDASLDKIIPFIGISPRGERSCYKLPVSQPEPDSSVVINMTRQRPSI